jgi:hypothetical protein
VDVHLNCRGGPEQLQGGHDSRNNRASQPVRRSTMTPPRMPDTTWSSDRSVKCRAGSRFTMPVGQHSQSEIAEDVTRRLPATRGVPAPATASNQYDNAPLALVYENNSQWCIVNQGGQNIPIGASFNVVMPELTFFNTGGQP